MATGKFTPQTRALILDGVRSGLFEFHAAALARVGESTLRRWKSIGRAEIDDLERFEDAQAKGLAELGEAPTISAYGEFFLDMVVAAAHAEKVALEQIQTSGKTDWRAAAWYLERKHAKRYGRAALRVDLDEGLDDNGEEITDRLLESIRIVEVRLSRAKGGGDVVDD